ERLIALEEAMKLQADADVDTIMKLDAEYRRSANLLQRKKEERQSFKEEAGPGAQDTDLARDKQMLKQLKTDLERQRERVKELSEFAELGDVTRFTTPLGDRARMTSPFGDRLDPLTKDGTTFHAGIDLEASAGTPVLSAFNGRIAKTGNDDELGLYVWIEHGNGIRTLYGHLSSVSVTQGQEVRQYEPIALSGNTGSRTTGEHLHFTVTINGTAVDPAAFVHAAG
ncbi:MAG: peptidoglycan DD-metalloendopeptidase family protein, partial [Cohnella sp.]|nr:peptidoglycan DD-metalloendopeptidase family protein [Cohnella sp.]